MNPYLQLPKVPVLRGRQQFVIDYCRDQRVLHVGCVDSGLVEERFALGALMHQKLAQVTTDLWGVDVDTAGIDFLRSAGFEQLILGDASQLHDIPALQTIEFDVIVASEVVEHLSNPGGFFHSVQALMVPGRTRLLVSVPNAFRIDTLLWMLRDVEFVHPDHNYWFSYRTITNLFVKNGLSVQEVFTYSFQPRLVMPNRLKRLWRKQPSTSQDTNGEPLPHIASSNLGAQAVNYIRTLSKRALASFLYRRSAFWADGLIIIATLPENDSH